MPPPPEQRCPSRWGAADERGSGNLLSPAKLVEGLVDRHPLLVGADNFAVEAWPYHPDRELFGPVHQFLLAMHGTYLLENLSLDELARDQVYEFAFVVQPLKIKGGTGSAVAPVAIR